MFKEFSFFILPSSTLFLFFLNRRQYNFLYDCCNNGILYFFHIADILYNMQLDVSLKDSDGKDNDIPRKLCAYTYDFT